MEKRLAVYNEMYQQFPDPENALLGCNMALNLKRPWLLAQCFSRLKSGIEAPENILHRVQNNRIYCIDIGLDAIAEAYGQWLEKYPAFKKDIYPGFARKCQKLAEKLNIQLMPDGLPGEIS